MDDTARQEDWLCNDIQGSDTGGRGAPSDPSAFGVAWCCNGAEFCVELMHLADERLEQRHRKKHRKKVFELSTIINHQ